MNITTPNTSPFDRAVREASARSAALLRSNCTLIEQSLIAFAPLVLIDIAFTYAGKCRSYAAKKHVLNLKPVCRAFDACTTRWQETIASALDYEHRNHIHHEAQKFMRECSNDFSRMWFTACNLWNNHMLRDLEMLIECDMMVLLPGWEHSRGCLTEVRFARKLGLLVLGYHAAEQIEYERYCKEHPVKCWK